jgi:hypothetical protein
MAIRRDVKEEKAKNEHASIPRGDAAEAGLPASEKEHVKEEMATKIPESTSSTLVDPSSSIYSANVSFSGQQDSSSSSQQQQQQQIAGKVLDETRDNIMKATKEARKELPRFTEAVNSIQDLNIQAATEVVENYIEIQRRLISSMQSSWVSYWEETVALFWRSFMSPQRFAELYANFVAGFADGLILASRTLNNYLLENIETFKNNVERARRNSNDLARACMNFAKLGIEQRDALDTKSQLPEEDTTIKTRSE